MELWYKDTPHHVMVAHHPPNLGDRLMPKLLNTERKKHILVLYIVEAFL